MTAKYSIEANRNMHSFVMVKLVFLLLFFMANTTIYAQRPAIIGFGWDYPDVAQLNERIGLMQQTPFDGICFSLQRNIMEVFDTTVHKDTYFEYDKLKSIKWGKYSDNYIILRGYSITGGNWFNDKAWVSITGNLRGLSKAMFIGKLKGLLFDPEYYLENPLYNPWTYSKAQYPNRSFEEVQNRVRERGKQFIAALQKYTVDFNFLSIWITSLIVEDKNHFPIEGTRHALLIPFIEGILLGKDKSVKIIDGDEFAYWYSNPTQFLESVDYLKKNTVELMRTTKGKQLATEIEIAQPVFYDGILALHPSFELGFARADKWRWLEENLKYAIATSNSNVVWFYYERVNWWKDKVNDTLINIMQNCKSAFIPGVENKSNSTHKLMQPKCYNVNTGEGYYYLYNPKKPMNTAEKAFSYNWEPKTKSLTLKYEGKIPQSVSVFVNNTLSVSFSPKNLADTIKLNNFTKGRLAILAKYPNNNVASGLHEY